MLSRRETGIQLAGSRRRIDQLEPGRVHVGEGEHRPGAGVAGIPLHCFLETGAHSGVSFQIEGTPEGERPLHAIVGEHGLRSGLRQLSGGSEVHHAIDLSEAARDSCCYVVLDIEELGRDQRLIVALAPQHLSRRAIGQPCAYPHSVRVPFHAAGDHIGRRSRRHPWQGHRVVAGRRRCEHLQPVKAHQIVDQPVGQSVREQLAAFAAAQGLERQDDHGRPGQLRLATAAPRRPYRDSGDQDDGAQAGGHGQARQPWPREASRGKRGSL